MVAHEAFNILVEDMLKCVLDKGVGMVCEEFLESAAEEFITSYLGDQKCFSCSSTLKCDLDCTGWIACE